MKTRLAWLLSFTLALATFAQEPAPAPLPAEGSRLTADQLEQLLGPIALYPDALIAVMLPAATAPADIVLAARYLRDGGDPDAVASRAWDESVKSLVHYADLVKWMDDNLAWTKQVGEAFRDQPAEVMQAIQRLRAKARAAGTLKDSPQQQVIADGDVIVIVPAQPDVLYVPYYDPAIVYASPPALYDSMPFMTFSPGFSVGPWLVFDCDWWHRTVWKVDHDHDRAEHDRRDWRHPVFPGQPGYVNDPSRHPWHPPANFPGRPKTGNDRPEDIARPVPLSHATYSGTAHNETPVSRGDSRPPSPRNDGRNRDANFNHPPITAPATAPAPVTTPAVAVTPPPDHHTNPARARDDTRDRPDRPVALPNPPSIRPALNNPAPVTRASPPPVVFPASQPPASRVMPALPGLVMAPPPPPPAAAPAPAAPPAQPPSDKGGSKDSDQKKQQY